MVPLQQGRIPRDSVLAVGDHGPLDEPFVVEHALRTLSSIRLFGVDAQVGDVFHRPLKPATLQTLQLDLSKGVNPQLARKALAAYTGNEPRVHFYFDGVFGARKVWYIALYELNTKYQTENTFARPQETPSYTKVTNIFEPPELLAGHGPDDIGYSLPEACIYTGHGEVIEVSRPLPVDPRGTDATQHAGVPLDGGILILRHLDALTHASIMKMVFRHFPVVLTAQQFFEDFRICSEAAKGVHLPRRTADGRRQSTGGSASTPCPKPATGGNASTPFPKPATGGNASPAPRR